MEIKRFGDKFIIELCQKKFDLFWSRKFRFGENFIRRFCERITDKELNLLKEVVDFTNNLVTKKEKPTEEQTKKMEALLAAAARIVFIQCYCYFKSLPVEDLKIFIDACYPLTYKTAQKQLEKFYSERFNGTECELEHKINEASCVEDWIVTRQMVAKFVCNDIVELFRFSILEEGPTYIRNVLEGKVKSGLAFNSFFIQLFQKSPYFSGLDKRNVEPKLKEDYVKKIVGIYDEICAYEDLKESEFKNDFPVNMKNDILSGSFIYTDTNNDILLQDALDALWLSARKRINLLKTEKEINRMGDLIHLVEAMYRALPRRKLTNKDEFYTKSDEERRNVVLGFFAYWDANMPDDLKVMQEEKDLKQKIMQQKQDNIDKSDLEHVGKTQAQINAEREANGGLTMELKDQDGKTVEETKLT